MVAIPIITEKIITNKYDHLWLKLFFNNIIETASAMALNTANVLGSKLTAIPSTEAIFLTSPKRIP